MTIVPTVFGMLKLAVRLEVPKYRIGVESLPKCDHAGIFDSSSGLGKKLAQLREGANKRLRPSHLGKPELVPPGARSVSERTVAQAISI